MSTNQDVCKGAWELGTACGKCARCLQAMPEWLEEVTAQRDSARNSNDYSKTVIARLVAERDALAAQVGALRKDAERYRWLRDEHWVEPEAKFRLGLSDTNDAATYERELDAAIDAKLEVQKP